MLNEFIAYRDARGFYHHLKKKHKNLIKRNEDFVLVIVGPERIGKSILSLRIYFDFAEGKVDIKNISFAGPLYRNNIVKSTKGDIITFDEAGTGMYSRDAMSFENKKINKALMVCGYKNLFHILCLPDYFELDTRVRNSRVSALIRITSRGRFVTYSKDKAKLIGRNRDYKKITPTSFGSWNHTDVTPEFTKFVKLYRKAEKQYKDKYMEKELIAEPSKDRYFSVTDFANKYNISRQVINGWIIDKKLHAIKVGNVHRISEKDFAKMVK